MDSEQLLFLMHFLEREGIESIIKAKTEGKWEYTIKTTEGLLRYTLYEEYQELKTKTD